MRSYNHPFDHGASLIGEPFNLTCEKMDGMTDERRGMKRIELGPTGHHVARSLSTLRTARGLTFQALSDELARLGWPIPELGLRRIEAQARRVTVDDLLALSVALDVSPLRLLLPNVGTDAAPTGFGDSRADSEELYAWARSETTLAPEARREYWQRRVAELESELEELSELESSSVSKARAWAARSRKASEATLEHARLRINALDELIDG